MLNLGFTQSALTTFHTRFHDEGMPEGLSSRDFAGFDRRGYDARDCARGAKAWQLRALDEYRSQVAFSELLMELTECGFAFDVLGTAVRVVRDEARHVELCRRMVEALGGSTKIEETPTYIRSDKRLPLRVRVLRTLVGSLCIGETISVGLLNGVRANTADPLAKAVITCLLADESIHSRFGWTLLPMLLPTLTAAERADLDTTLPLYLSASAQVVKASAPVQESPLACAPANPFGSLPASARADIFRESVENEVIRPFEALGVKARGAWEKVAA